jgi:hypothetical protein
MVIMADTVTYFITPSLVQTPRKNGNPPVSPKPSILYFIYILVMVNTSPFIEADDYFNNTLLACGHPQIKHVLHSYVITKANSGLLCTAA